ncbi:MAG TPA: sulfate adenylyltransferase, partial [Saprospiraceae bacterium]|nr:sulfate adenylyltransferase [Saprospiraceae bacterium]
DLAGYSEQVFQEIRHEFEAFAAKLDVHDLFFIPISALHGDNVVERSAPMAWYQGPTLLYYLENVHIASDHNLIDARFPVQNVLRPNTDEFHDYRGYAGRVAGGVFKPGDEVMLLPSGFTTRIERIDTFDGPVQEAFPPMSVTILLEGDHDLGRGDMIVRPNNQPNVGQDLEATICWFDSRRALQPGGKYLLRHTTREVRAMVKEVRYKLDVNTLHRNLEDTNLAMNDIGRVVLRTTQPLFFDEYHQNRTTGSFILIDEQSNNTVAAGMIL